MAVKRGVTSFSYQNLILDYQMDYHGFIREVREHLGADGIEIIDEQIIQGYPFLDDRFVYDFRNTMARYNMHAENMDVYLDVLQFRDHVMNSYEAAERLKRDIGIAARLGFANVRALATIPIDVIEMALPTAEKLGVKIGVEIHSPTQLVATEDHKVEGHYTVFKTDYRIAEKVCQLRDRTGSPFVGLIPDMGSFHKGVIPYVVRSVRKLVKNDDAVDLALELRDTMPVEDICRIVAEKYPNCDLRELPVILKPNGASKLEDLKTVLPYVISCHGKFYEMVEDPQNPGHYYEPSIDYKAIFDILNEGGYDGYMDSEYEGQAGYNGWVDPDADEIEQVRRQHEMMKDFGAV